MSWRLFDLQDLLHTFSTALGANLLVLGRRLIDEYTQPMMVHGDDVVAPLGSHASKAATPPRRTTPSPKASPKVGAALQQRCRIL